MQAETSEKQYRAVDPVSRFRWALQFPDISHAAGKVLAALADHADQRRLTCWPSVATLARETQVSERGVQCALRSLEAAGAITTEPSRGRTSNIYRLMISVNPAGTAGLNPAESVPTPQNLYLNPAESAPLNPAESAPQQSHSLEQSKKEQSKQQQHLHVREVPAASIEPDGQHPAAAANHSVTVNGTDPEKRRTCPQCANTWPERFGTVCFKCQCDLQEHSYLEEVTARLDKEMGRELPESWLHQQGLKQLIGARDFEQVCAVMLSIGPNRLPTPQSFFNNYSKHLQEAKQQDAQIKAGIAAMEAELQTPSSKPELVSNGTRRAA